MSLQTERARAARKIFTVVELELDYCQLTYGTLPCTAAIGSTGTAPCFNSVPTCQDPNNYDNGAQPASVKTYRFCTKTADFPRDLDAVPCVESVNIAAAELAVGAGLGKRGVATIVLSDGLHTDDGIDKYVDQRAYEPIEQGTMLGRLLARNRYFLGRKVRIWRGYLTEGPRGSPAFDFANAEKRVYFMEKAEGPINGRVTITAKDPFKLIDDERAVAPLKARGRLLAGITAVSAAATLTPTGIGDATDLYGRALYPASGKIRINNEIISFTRVGDALTLTARGQNNTTAAAHDADDAVQPCLIYTSQALHAIANDLLTTFGRLPASMIDTVAWQQEFNDFSGGRLYSTIICEPTGVSKLVEELCEQGPAYFWPDDVNEKIVYRAMRPAASAATTLEDGLHMLKGSVSVKTRLDLRISEVVFNFGQRNPTEALDKASNYQVSVIKVGESAATKKYGQHRTKTINSRWLGPADRSTVEAVCDVYLQRYDEAPREISLKATAKDATLMPGDLFKASTKHLQGIDGLPAMVTFQVTKRGGDDREQYAYTALEERYSASAGVRNISFAASQYLSINLRTEHDSQFTPPSGPVVVTFTVELGTVVGSGGGPAITVGDWPEGSLITLVVKGRVQGQGGRGGSGEGFDQPIGNGQPGSVAIYTRFPLILNLASGLGQVWGGGGGGGGGDTGGGGGGGAGTKVGKGNDGGDGGAGADGTALAGGLGGSPNGGSGGGPGQPGQDGAGIQGGDGGAAGPALDGISYTTIIGTGDVRGPQVN